jgi:hypothetical protein
MKHLGFTKEEEVLKYVAIDHIAAVRLERASRAIFGSQLNAINHLNHQGGRLPVETLRLFYTNAATASPQIYANYMFEQWLGYLTSWDLIRIDGSDAVITAAGKAIFFYMQSWGYLTVWPHN